jgi:putative DNA primase/helicase
LLHLPTRQHLEPTPNFFTTTALDFDPDPGAPLPAEWLLFLCELFGDDIQAIDLLQEWFGYCLTGDTSLQKMLLMVGPRRSGKGTIARVLTRLVGSANVCGPTTHGLAGPFGLQPLLGKGLAIVSDARFSGDNVQTVIERLLCISGEDALTVDRKFLESVTLKLPLKFMFLSNELPRLSDSSAALAGRFLLLRLTKSFYGREDPKLTDKLLMELPGILNWAIDGWHRLHERGHFQMPTSVEDAVLDMEDLASPVGAFVREECVVGAGQRVWVDDLYEAWRRWCEREGRTLVSTRQSFGRDLAAAVPGLHSRRNQTHGRFYEGIGLRAANLVPAESDEFSTA